jgi:hypothetical protein
VPDAMKWVAQSAGAQGYSLTMVHEFDPCSQEGCMGFFQAILLGFAFALGAFLFQSVLGLGQRLLSEKTL